MRKKSGRHNVTFGTNSIAGRFEYCLKWPMDRHENSGIARAREGEKSYKAAPRLQPSLTHDIAHLSERRVDSNHRERRAVCHLFFSVVGAGDLRWLLAAAVREYG